MEEPRLAAPPPPALAPPAPAPTVNYKEAWKEAANRNLFNLLSKSRKSRELSSTIARPDVADSAAVSSALGGSAAQHRTSEESPSSDSEENTYDALDDARLEALPILEQYSATASSTRSQEVEEVEELAGELPELEVVGGEVVGMKKRQTKLASPDLWKVIAPKGLVVHAGSLSLSRCPPLSPLFLCLSLSHSLSP